MSEFTSEQPESQCPYEDQCDFVQNNAEKVPELINRTRQRYCHYHPERCARYTLYEKNESSAVPPLMLPDQHEWARQIDEEYRLDHPLNTQGSSAE